MNKLLQRILFTVLFIFIVSGVYAGSIITAIVNNGAWKTGATWSGGVVPTTGDLAIIPPGVTVVYTTGYANGGNENWANPAIYVYGTLKFTSGTDGTNNSLYSPQFNNPANVYFFSGSKFYDSQNANGFYLNNAMSIYTYAGSTYQITSTLGYPDSEFSVNPANSPADFTPAIPGTITGMVAVNANNPNNLIVHNGNAPPVVVPLAVTNAVTNITGSSATFNGAAYSTSVSSSVIFRYSLNSDLSSSSTINASSATLAANTTSTTLTASPALIGAKTYYYRIEATNSAGTAVGATQSFTTPNNPPTIAGTVAGQAVNDNATIAPFSSVNIIDPDGQTQAVTVTLNNTANGSFTTLNGFTNAGSGVYTYSGTPANAQAAIRGMVFTPTANQVAPGNTITSTFTIALDDGAGGTTSNNSTTVVSTSINDAPVLAGTNTLSYTENGAAAVINGNITVADADNATLPSATVSIISGFVSGQDVLSFANTANITGTYSAITGVLSLTGSSATSAQWQAALRSITYSNTSDNPSTSARTVAFTINDGAATSNALTSLVTVTAVNDAPVLSGGSTITYIENAAATAINTGIVVSDPDNTTQKSATISITNNFQSSQDALAFISTGSATMGDIAVLSNASGALTLSSASGTATLAQWQNALRAVTYVNNSDNPVTTARSVSFTVNDGATSSLAVTSTISVTAVNDAPVISSGSTLSYTENGAAAAINTGITVTDVDNTTLASATVAITGGFAGGEDVLSFANTANVTGVYNTGTGIMTLTGSSATVAQMQAALQSVKYSNTSDNPSTSARTVSFFVNDGAVTSNVITSTVNITAVNDAPILASSSTITYTENDAATAINTAIAVSDIDNTTLKSAAVSINNFQSGQDVLGFINMGNALMGDIAVQSNASGILILSSSSGGATLAQWQRALRAVTYSNSSDAPATTARSVSFTVNDGSLNSNTINSTINITAVNDAPVLAGTNTLNYLNGTTAAVIDPNLTVTDADNTNMTVATVSIASNYAAGDILAANTTGTSITASYNSGALILSGSDTKANYQAVLRSVTYRNSSSATTSKTINYTVSDGDLSSSTLSNTVNIAPVPSVSTGGTLAALSSNVGNASTSTSFTIQGANLQAGILVTPPAGFEVGIDNSTFAAAITVGAAGTIGTTTVYVRLAAADAAGTYSGNIVLSSTNLTSVNVSTASSTVSAVSNDATLSALTVSAGTLSTIFNAATTAYAITTSGSNTTVTATAANAFATLQVQLNGGGYSTLTSGTASGTLAFTAGTNTINLKATAQDGTTIKIYTVTVLRPPGNALAFDGVNDAVMLTAPPATVAGSYTIEAWVKPNVTGGPSAIFNSRNPTENGFDLKLLDGNKIHADIGSGSTWLSTNADANFNYTAGQWLHIAYVVTPGTYTIFVNGNQAATGTLTAGTPLLVDASHYLNIGYNAGDNNYLNGAIDEVKIYNTNLTQANIKADMANTTASVPGNLAYYYDFDNGTPDADNSTVSTTLKDKKGTYDGTLTGFALNGTASNFVQSYATIIPAAPTAGNVTATGFTLTWPVVTGATSYLLDVSPDGFSTFASGYNSLAVTGLSQAVSGLISANTYSFRIRAVNSDGISTNSVTGTQYIYAPPVIGGTVAAQQVNDNAVITPFSTITITDTDVPARTQAVSVTVDDNNKGHFTTLNGFTDTGNGIYRFSGTAVNAQAAMRGMVFTPTANRVSTGSTETTTLYISVADGLTTTNDNTTTILSKSINDAPVISNAVSTQPVNDNATINPFSAISITDSDPGTSLTLTVTLDDAAKGSFTTLNGFTSAGNGVYTYSGPPSTVQGVMSGLVFTPTAHRVAVGSSETTTFTVAANDGFVTTSDNNTSVISTAVDPPVVVTGGGSASFTQQYTAVAVVPNLTVTDNSSATLASATINSIIPISGDSLAVVTTGTNITANFDMPNDILYLTGVDTKANYQKVLRSLTYMSVSTLPTDPNQGGASRTLSFVVNDGTLNSKPVTTMVGISVSSQPLLVNFPSQMTVTAGSGPQLICPNAILGSTIGFEVGDNSIIGTAVDLLVNGTGTAYTSNACYFGPYPYLDYFLNSATDPANISPWGYNIYPQNPGSSFLFQNDFMPNLIVTRQELQAVIKSLTFNAYVNKAQTFQIHLVITYQGRATNDEEAQEFFQTVNIIPVSTPPVLTAGNSVHYTPSGTSVAISPAITLTDAAVIPMTSATVSITSGFLAGDVLTANTSNTSIGSSYNSATGVLTLTGLETVADFQTVLQSITYSSTAADPGNAGANRSRTLTYVVNDGNLNSTAVTSTVNIVGNTIDNLAISAGTLSPAFDPGINTYTVSVSGVDHITLTPYTNNASATIKVNGAAVASGSTSDPIALNIGDNVITLILKAQNGTENTYTLTVTRLRPALTSTSFIGQLGNEYGTPTGGTSFDVGGSNLLSDITVTAPAGYEISQSPTGTFTNSLILPQSDGTVSLTAIYLRLAAADVVGTYSGDIVVTATSATDLHIATVASAVTPKNITITADDKTKIYGDTDPALTYSITSGGLVNGDAFAGSLARVTGEDAGAYAINQGTLALNSNYNLTYEIGNFNIGQKTITVTADAKLKVYDDTDPALTYQITSGALLNSDVITGALSRQIGENAGSYSITQGTLQLSPNYTLNYVGANLTIGQRAITVTFDPQFKTYGEQDPIFSYQITSGALVPSDSFDGAVRRESGENVGTYHINQGTLALSSNYALTYVGADLAINAQTITVTADAKSKTYGTDDPALTYNFSPALVGSDTFSGQLSRANSGTLTGEQFGDYTISQGSLTAGDNYQLNFTGSTLHISAATLNITANAQSKAYGTADPTLTYTTTGLVNTTVDGLTINDAASILTGALTRATGEQPGSYAINQGSLASISNYNLSYSGNSLTITPTIANEAELSSLASSVGAVVRTSSTAYTITVSGLTVSSLHLKAATTDPRTTLTINGNAATSNVATADFAINTGSTPTVIPIVILAEDGITTKTVLVTINHTPSSNADLKSLALKGGTAVTQATASTFTATTTAQSVVVLASTLDAGATLKVNGTTVASGAYTDPINLVTGSNTITTVVTAEDGTTKTYTLTVTKLPSGNADLKSLLLKGGTAVTQATPTTFTATTTAQSVVVVASVMDAGATLKVNGTTVASGAYTDPINLVTGSNTITTVVTAEDGTAKTYTLTVTKLPSGNADLKSLLLKGGLPVTQTTPTTFTATTTVQSVVVVASAIDAGATLKVNGTMVTSGAYTDPINLVTGSNTITTVITAEDGTTKTYTLTVTRVPSGNADLKSLLLKGGTPVTLITPTTYTATTTATQIVVVASVMDANATLKVNGTSVAPGAYTDPINLVTGTNTVTTVVTAEDGSTKTYTLTITRQPSGNADLKGLASSVGTLAEVSSTAYTITINGLTVNKLHLRALTADLRASLTINNVAATSGVATADFAINTGTTATVIPVVIVAEDGVTTTTVQVTVNHVASSNADLKSLLIKGGLAITQTTPGTYTATTTATQVVIIAATADAGATLKINGATVASGAYTNAINLVTGTNTITTVVTAEDGTTKTYTLTITRQLSSNADLKGLALNGGTVVTQSSSTQYTATVMATSILVRATVADARATLKINGTSIASGVYSGSLLLTTGTNTITTVVTAEDGTAKTYTLTITRLPSSNADLKGIVLGGGITPAQTDATNYTASVSTATVTVRTVTVDANATVKINGTTVAPGSYSSPINLATGANTITILITAEDGTTKTYTLTVTTTATTSFAAAPVTGEQTLNIPPPSSIIPANILSPNGDGKNDTWIVKDIDYYPNNTVTIYDHAGKVVYTKKGYSNEWDGSTQSGSPLPQGTYYYILKLSPDIAPIKGFISILRSN